MVTMNRGRNIPAVQHLKIKRKRGHSLPSSEADPGERSKSAEIARQAGFLLRGSNGNRGTILELGRPEDDYCRPDDQKRDRSADPFPPLGTPQELNQLRRAAAPNRLVSGYRLDHSARPRFGSSASHAGWRGGEEPSARLREFATITARCMIILV